ncbi:RNase A-like domain-containing protein [Burkholderia latens]|nr:RNase A-like domain-containing protein [Burkholderia latens]
MGRFHAYLNARLRIEPDLRLVSSFTGLAEAEWAISRVMQTNTSRVDVV